MSKLPELKAGQDWCCGGCGSGIVKHPKKIDFVYSLEVFPNGDRISKSTVQYVAPCCGGELLLWDESKQDFIPWEYVIGPAAPVATAGQAQEDVIGDFQAEARQKKLDEYVAGWQAQAVAVPDLTPVIHWLEGGCDPAWAAKELRAYQKRLGQKEAPALTPEMNFKQRRSAFMEHLAEASKIVETWPAWKRNMWATEAPTAAPLPQQVEKGDAA